MNVFTQTEVYISFKTEVPSNHNFLAPHEYSKKAGDFACKSVTHHSSLKFDGDDDFSANDETLQVNYASADYFFLTLQLFHVKFSLQG